ncbi:diguanylate cyclase [Anoxybacillus flavithermus]|uniref:Diguanylate cyclase n=1 Tax=Anoxybacillus flavithermus TaxID=33934 RepID=A0A2G5RTZ8_9BACL|nr:MULTISPECIES: diguanylate cyclase [Anoxybacillus]KFZ43576.1 diguanylate cyclase [Anoxybacillus sp. KU2-6(11)]PIC06183.1 diguanylate cyclase [Anoxybacillus flavithermus]
MDRYEKYRQHFLKNIRKRLEEWETVDEIAHQDVYRLLHSIAGTAAMIGMTDIGNYARKLMEQWGEDEQKIWKTSDVKDRLAPLFQLCYEQQIGEVAQGEQGAKQGDEPTVLLIDDDPSFLMYVKEQLEQNGWYVVAIADPVKAVASFYDVRPDCVVIDIHMQTKTGFEVLTFLKEKLKQQFVPMIMVSIDDRKETRMKSYEMGADDFISKPFAIDEFIVRIRRQLERKQLIDELLLLDELTHVYNRKYLKQAYEQLKSDWHRTHEPFCLAVLDIDHFKRVNDQYGHLIGDVVLKQFAEFLKTNVRARDIVIRFGGEEFVVLLPATEASEAFLVFERLREQFERMTFQSGDVTFSCTFSTGIVEVTDPTNPIGHWIELADSALYKAKHTGRNCVVLAKQQETSYRRTVKVAIVDDDAIVRAIVADVVQKMFAKEKVALDLRTFKDGEQFITSEWHREKGSCLVILDGVMPKMDGLEVLQQLRSQKDSSKYKIIMLTARKSENDIARALELGADDYMTKPFKLLELEARIRHMLKRMN